MLKHNVTCPNCGASRCIKNGRVNGKQTYLCKECFSRFSTDRVRKRYSKEIKKQAVLMYRDGFTLTEISKRLNIKVQTIHYWIKNN
ncbi:transposase [Persephonella sp.]|jgi:transposase-like protein